MSSDNTNNRFGIKKIIEKSGLDGKGQNYTDFMNSVTPAQIKNELAQRPGVFSIERLMRLISPAAEEFIEEMAQQARLLTQQRFGKTMQLYVPMYVSNFCINSCKYCGYNKNHNFQRVRLTLDQACKEAEVIASQGFKHILFLCGEDPKHIDLEYMRALALELRKNFCAIEIEVYPLDQSQYSQLYKVGVDGISVYQETYDTELYKQLHPSGPKSDYLYRLETLDRAASAGFRRLGLGALLGLKDWRIEALALGLHGDYLMKNYWQSQIVFSFPRIRPAHDVKGPMYENLISDKHFVQMMLAMRLCFADAGITISTRESAEFRKHLIKICVTKISAGSKTNPGGYSQNTQSVPQFEVDDKSSPQQVAQLIKSSGYEAVWKDWDHGFYDV